jgi:multiple sugar transport system substrate-binding protein
VKNKLFWFISLLIVASILLVSCGSPATATPAASQPTAAPVIAQPTAAPAEAQPTAATASEKKKVTIFVGFGTGTDPDQVKAQEVLAKKFNDTHDDIQVDILIVPNEEAEARFLAMVAGDDAPQLVGPIGIDRTARFKEMWEDVTPYIEKDSYDTSDFYGPSATLNKYPDLNAGLPLGLYPSFLFYNKDLFDAAGLPYPTHDYADKSWNLSALRDVAMKLTLDANDKTPLDAGFDPKTIKQWGYADTYTDLRGLLTMFGAPSVGRPTSADYKTAQVNSAEWNYGAQWLFDSIHKDYFFPDSVGQTTMDANAGDPFSTGQVAMWYSHTWFMSEGLNGLPFKYDLAPLFYNQKGERISRISADVFTIPKNAKNKDAAWEVEKWLVAPEQLVDVCKIYGCLPSRKSSQEAYLNYMKERYPNIDYDVIFKAIDYLDNPTFESWVPEWGKVADAMNNTQTILYTEDKLDVPAIMKTTNDEVQKILDDYWAKQ